MWINTILIFLKLFVGLSLVELNLAFLRLIWIVQFHGLFLILYVANNLCYAHYFALNKLHISLQTIVIAKKLQQNIFSELRCCSLLNYHRTHIIVTIKPSVTSSSYYYISLLVSNLKRSSYIVSMSQICIE